MSNKEFVILGIDPGIADTGYGLVLEKNNKFECLTYGSIKTSSKLPLSERLIILNQELSAIIKKYQPDLVAVEELFFCNNAKTALIVGQARGVVLLTIEQSKIPLLEFTPLEVKRAIACYGQATKLQVQKMVKMLLNLKELPKPDDAADALAIAICGANSRKLLCLKK